MTENKRIYCNTCKHETNHKLLSTHDRDYHEEEYHQGQCHLVYYEKFIYGFWVCLGCDTCLLEEKYTCSGMSDYDGSDLYSYEDFPARSNRKTTRAPKKFVHINKKLNTAYKEIIKAYNQGLEIITAMGIRALLEAILVEEGIDDKVAYNLTKKIKEIEKRGIIPSGIIEGLKSIKFFDNDAAHRLNSTNSQTILLSIELLEALLTQLYEAKFDLEKKADLVKKAHNKPLNADSGNSPTTG